MFIKNYNKKRRREQQRAETLEESDAKFIDYKLITKKISYGPTRPI